MLYLFLYFPTSTCFPVSWSLNLNSINSNLNLSFFWLLKLLFFISLIDRITIFLRALGFIIQIK